MRVSSDPTTPPPVPPDDYALAYLNGGDYLMLAGMLGKLRASQLANVTFKKGHQPLLSANKYTTPQQEPSHPLEQEALAHMSSVHFSKWRRRMAPASAKVRQELIRSGALKPSWLRAREIGLALLLGWMLPILILAISPVELRAKLIAAVCSILLLLMLWVLAFCFIPTLTSKGNTLLWATRRRYQNLEPSTALAPAFLPLATAAVGLGALSTFGQKDLHHAVRHAESNTGGCSSSSNASGGCGSNSGDGSSGWGNSAGCGGGGGDGDGGGGGGGGGGCGGGGCGGGGCGGS